MNQIVMALNASLFTTLVALYFLKPFALGFVADFAFNALVFEHPFTYAIRQRRPQIIPFLDVVQRVRYGMERTLAEFSLVNVKEFPDEDVVDAMRVVTTDTTRPDAPVVLIMS